MARWCDHKKIFQAHSEKSSCICDQLVVNFEPCSLLCFRLRNDFVILIFCRPESRFLELIPREESEDSESAIPRLILKRQNTPSDDSTPPKVKYFLKFFDMLQNMS